MKPRPPLPVPPGDDPPGEDRTEPEPVAALPWHHPTVIIAVCGGDMDAALRLAQAHVEAERWAKAQPRHRWH